MINSYMKDTDLDQTIAQLGESIKNIVNTSISVKDVRIERTDSLEFQAQTGDELFGKGLVWKSADGVNKKFMLRHNSDRLWSTESIDLDQGKSYKIDNIDVINQTSLGPTVRNSNLTKLGTLSELNVVGNVNIDSYVFWNSEAGRLGIGTEEPKGLLSLANLEGEMIFNIDNLRSSIGTYSNTEMSLVTGNMPRLTIASTGKISVHSDTAVHGKLLVGLYNPDPDTDLSVKGNIRFAEKKFETGTEIPTNGTYRLGDIVWNNNPQPTGYVGWVCIREGTPGEWKAFGQIHQ